MKYSVGIDVGSSAIKTVLIATNHDNTKNKILAKDCSKIRKRMTKDVIDESFDNVLKSAGLLKSDIGYVATTGEGEMVDFRTGHFYSMTCHSRGALEIASHVRAVVDLGALHCKAMIMDDRSKVLGYKMTSQCASGSGQFIENISRYLGIRMDEIGELSMSAQKPEVVSSICAVLAETDVINMVSRGISAADILKGIHVSMARRIIKLLRTLKVRDGSILVTGGLAMDSGLLCALQEGAAKEQMKVSIERDELSPFAGALGAAIWGGVRHNYLERQRAKDTQVMMDVGA